jgi:hypothetical protein
MEREAAKRDEKGDARDKPKEEKRRKVADEGRKKEEKVPRKSVGGWVIMVTGLSEEFGAESQLRDLFSTFGRVERIVVNKSFRSGVASSALVEFEMASECEAAIAGDLPEGCKAGFAFVEK